MGSENDKGGGPGKGPGRAAKNGENKSRYGELRMAGGDETIKVERD